MRLHDRLLTGHRLLDKKRNKTNYGLYYDDANKASTCCFLIKLKRKRRNTVKRLETIVFNGLKPCQIHQTPGVKN